MITKNFGKFGLSRFPTVIDQKIIANPDKKRTEKTEKKKVPNHPAPGMFHQFPAAVRTAAYFKQGTEKAHFYLNLR
ncbi:MAG: hypothetical protein E7051_02690 [Lentisphaerae bacterium]|nr:hypothetical protein [Lentisphaerota bacterium]